MKEPTIIVEQLSKNYHIDHGKTKKIKEWLETVGRKKQERKKVFALDKVSFSVRQGEILGIIGVNGSGKSTLLKILAQITPPSAGSAKIWGKTACLIEVGTGFNRELTGLENIYLNGAILGMKKKEITAKLVEIISFSELNPVALELPIKKFSSGMKIRLAFSIVTHLAVDILLMDEILAVSDIGFQQKGLRKLQQLAENGKTIIYVSHDLDSVRRICNRCLVLDKGKLLFTGLTQAVIEYYLQHTISDMSNSLKYSAR